MSSLPRRNRVVAALQKNAKLMAPPPSDKAGLNIPVGPESVPTLLEKAKEVHQHNVIKHIVMAVQDDESLDCVCLFCGGTSQIRKPYTPAEEINNEIFLLFKQLHVGCEVPQNPIGFFNADSREKRNPVFVNKATGVHVELRNIRASAAHDKEEYHFVDLQKPGELLMLDKKTFMESFIPLSGTP